MTNTRVSPLSALKNEVQRFVPLSVSFKSGGLAPWGHGAEDRPASAVNTGGTSFAVPALLIILLPVDTAFSIFFLALSLATGFSPESLRCGEVATFAAFFEADVLAPDFPMPRNA